ncbi:Conserved oligomeric Golgi complex subunit 5 [Escovopsis weberi]|uniref:Conserved oligomeric Golgi complex subunit 5 n=1 Tax=Escovopsis weberi TaxID=150374 RepID=A0A0M8NAH2_ESCWE|nr:Conserved oligomeric Golgi complex subunit 5 [Escovopsis weberi]
MAAPASPPPRPSDEPSYIDYEAFLSPDFDPAAFANTLVVATNNPNDSPLDLSTPLSRVLFDAQEVDSHIDALTTRSAEPLLEHTRAQNEASQRIVSELDAQIRGLNDSYRQLEKEVIDKHAEADEVRQVALRLWETLTLSRSVGRCLQLGRQLEAQFAELGGAATTTTTTTTTTTSGGSGSGGSGGPGIVVTAKEDHGALVRCSYTILSLREMLDSKAPGEEGHGLDRVDAIRSLQTCAVSPVERSVRDISERLVRDFSMPGTTTFAQGEDARSRLLSAVTALYLLSPSPSPSAGIDPDAWTPRLLLQALESHIHLSLQTSVSSVARALAQLPILDKALSEVASRCQSIVSLGIILEAAKPPPHPRLPRAAQLKQPPSLIEYLLSRLETGSLTSYFWRTLASNLASRVQDTMARGGVAARTLRTNKAAVGDAVRQAVVKGCQPPTALVNGKEKAKADVNRDREIAIMVGSVMNNVR